MFYQLKDINSSNFEEIALKVFEYQYLHIDIYRKFCEGIHKTPENITNLLEIPFLPIQFFKTHRVYPNSLEFELFFESSGTSKQDLSRHYIKSIEIYYESLTQSIEHFFPLFEEYEIYGLLPHYLERPNSSLVTMVSYWLDKNQQANSRFYLHDLEQLKTEISQKLAQNKKVLLIGISFALIDLSEIFKNSSHLLTIIETGGMKGRGKEIPKNELFSLLRASFPHAQILSEYGMCELLSQAYSDEQLNFHTPKWMKALVSELNDPLTTYEEGKGVAKIIDLANYYSCSFIETQDLIQLNKDTTFNILGRKDNSDIRGCSLMY